mgnify:CR=1 FL=1
MNYLNNVAVSNYTVNISSRTNRPLEYDLSKAIFEDEDGNSKLFIYDGTDFKEYREITFGNTFFVISEPSEIKEALTSRQKTIKKSK